MKTQIGLLCTFFFFVCAEAQEYLIRYQNLTSGSLFHIETPEGEKVGKVVREQQKDNVFYYLLDKKEQTVAKARTEHHKQDTIVICSGPQGEELGWFSAAIYNLYPSEYKVFSSQRMLIAKGSMSWLGNSFALADPENAKFYLVTFSRPRFKLFNDYWHFQIHVAGAIDFRILCILGAFQTACDVKFESL